MKKFKIHHFLIRLALINFYFFTVNQSLASSWTQEDLDEVNGILHPESTKILDYEFGKNGTKDENGKHALTVALKYIKKAKEWYEKQEEEAWSKEYAKAIGAAFTWVNLCNPYYLHDIDSIIHKFIQTDKMTFKDLWLKNLPQANAKPINGELYYIEAIAQFNKRMLSGFQGNVLLIGAGHESNLRELGEPYYSSNAQPTIHNYEGRKSYPLDKENYYTMDIDAKEEPDIIANAKIVNNIKVFPTERFNKIIFNYIPFYDILTSEEIMQEYYRILSPSGIIEFKGKHHAKAQNELQDNKNTIKTILEKCSFQIKELEIKTDKDAIVPLGKTENTKQFLYLKAAKKNFKSS